MRALSKKQPAHEGCEPDADKSGQAREQAVSQRGAGEKRSEENL
jgi:hypothetical protein